MSRKDMEKKQAENRVPEEKPASPITIGLFVLGLFGIALVAFILVWTLTDGPKPGMDSSPSQSMVSQASLSISII